MSVRLGDTAPDFVQDATEGPVHFPRWVGDGWAVLFSHPTDFTPLCTTEFGAGAKLKPEFDRRNLKIVGLSVDAVADHREWSEEGISLDLKPRRPDANLRVAGLPKGWSHGVPRLLFP